MDANDWLNPFQNKPWFFRDCNMCKYFGNTVGKGEIARDEQYLLFSHCFLPLLRTFHHFHQISNCCLQTLSFWKRLNPLPHNAAF